MRTTIRSKALAASAAALLILGMAACTNDPEPNPTTIEAAPTGDTSDNGGATSQAQTTAPAKDGECQAKDGDQNLPKDAPKVDAWQDVNGLSVPVSKTYGPYTQEGDLWTCYEHSPLGAVFAAQYLFAATGSVEGLADAWVPDSSFREELRDSEGQQASTTEGATGTPAGFRVTSYAPDKAVVDSALEISTSQGTTLTSLRWTLAWDGSRWQIDPAAAESMQPTSIDSLDGYINWGKTNG